MKLKRIILLASGVTLFLGLFALLAPSGDGDVSKVRIGFAGYGVVDGKQSLILMVTNGSSYRISQPGERWELRGDSPDGDVMISCETYSNSCGVGTAKWGWWQLRPPKIPSIAPEETFRFAIPVDEKPYTWRVTIAFATIPFRDRLPFALRYRWPSTKRDTRIAFEVSLGPIPPTPSPAMNAASGVDSVRTRP